VVVQEDGKPDTLCLYVQKTKQKQTILGVKSEMTHEAERYWESDTTDVAIEKVTTYTQNAEDKTERLSMVSE